MLSCILNFKCILYQMHCAKFSNFDRFCKSKSANDVCKPLQLLRDGSPPEPLRAIAPKWKFLARPLSTALTPNPITTHLSALVVETEKMAHNVPARVLKITSFNFRPVNIAVSSHRGTWLVYTRYKVTTWRRCCQAAPSRYRYWTVWRALNPLSRRRHCYPSWTRHDRICK